MLSTLKGSSKCRRNSRSSEVTCVTSINSQFVTYANFSQYCLALYSKGTVLSNDIKHDFEAHKPVLSGDGSHVAKPDMSQKLVTHCYDVKHAQLLPSLRMRYDSFNFFHIVF